MTPHHRDLDFLDGMRGLAALYVLVGHARWLLWEGFGSYSQHSQSYHLLGKLVVYASALARFGHEAVIFFFVLSGFVIHLRYARLLLRDPHAPFDLFPYLSRRARRLYPPLIAALAITYGLDRLGQSADLPTATGTTLYPLINEHVRFDHSAVTLTRNLAFVTDPVFGSDGPLWSLGYEWYFYLLYPLVFGLARRSWKAATIAMTLTSALGFLPVWGQHLDWPRHIFQMMLIWWFGATLADSFIGRPGISLQALRWLMPCLGAVFVKQVDPFLRDIVIGLGFAGLLAGLLDLKRRGWRLSPLVKLKPLGEFSYSLYVIHFPILVLLSGWLMKTSAGRLPAHFGWAVCGVFGSLAVAWGLHLVVERPFVRHRSGNSVVRTS